MFFVLVFIVLFCFVSKTYVAINSWTPRVWRVYKSLTPRGPLNCIYFLASDIKTLSSLQTYSLSFGVAQIAGYRLAFITSVLPTVLDAETAQDSSLEQEYLLIPPHHVIIQSKKSACALSVCHAISDIMNIPDFCATCFVDSDGSSVHPAPALNLWTTSDLLTQRPKNSKVLTMKLSASALWRSTAAHYSDVVHWHVNTQRVTGETGTLLPLQIPEWLPAACLWHAHVMLSGWYLLPVKY